jgi:predicted RNA-binding protein Jag
MTAEDASAIAAKAQGVLSEILNLMGVKASIETRAGEKGEETILEIRAENSGLLIGRKGQTLEALQYLVTRIAGERPGGEGPQIIVDIENYRERRRKSLEDMALQDDPWVTTKSLGQGSYRRLLIIPEGDRKKKPETKPIPEREGAKATK